MPEASPHPPLLLRPAAAPALAFALALAARLVLIAVVPYNYSFDGYQRWGGREHLLVQDWLPATQSILWLTDALGGGILAARVALAVVASLAVAAGVVIARSLGGPAAGWLYVLFGLFPSFLAWSAVPYQEGTFLLLAFAGFALALDSTQTGSIQTGSIQTGSIQTGSIQTGSIQTGGGPRARLAADLVLGALALVRYEGWPLVLLYIAWQRRWSALVALWGALLWLGLKLGLGAQGYAASPVDFADWVGLGQRVDLATVGASLAKLARQAWVDGAWLVMAVGLVGAWRLRRRPGAWVLALALVGQIAAVMGWMLGLETASYRMQVVACALAGLFAAGLLGPLAARLGRRGRAAAIAASLALCAVWLWLGVDQARDSVASVRPEITLLQEMDACPSCLWVIEPRRRLGTRDRHDGCEVVQGSSQRLAGRDFWCAAWPGQEPPATAVRAIWTGAEYSVPDRLPP